MKPYYYVLRKNGQPPTVRHATLALAVTEAERLANQHPGETFEILKAVAESRVQGPASTFFMDGEGEVSLDDLAREGYDAHTRNLGARNACPPARPSGYPVFPSLDRLAKLAEADAYKIALGRLAEAKQKLLHLSTAYEAALAKRINDPGAFTHATKAYNESQELFYIADREVTAFKNQAAKESSTPTL